MSMDRSFGSGPSSEQPAAALPEAGLREPAAAQPETGTREPAAAQPDLPASLYREICRYLGYRGITPDDEIRERIGRNFRALRDAAGKRSVFRAFPVSFPAEGTIRIGSPADAGFEVRSRDLYRNLRGCSEVILLAVTIGPGPDLLVRRAEVGDLPGAAILQAAGAAMAEEYCDEVNRSLEEQARGENRFLRPRYSPGYGDFSLEFQKDFSRLLDMPRTIGVSLTDSLLMVPSKSITAVIGVSDTPPECAARGCDTCGASGSCPYRAT